MDGGRTVPHITHFRPIYHACPKDRTQDNTPASFGTSPDEALKALAHHAQSQWAADRLTVGGVVPIAGDIGIMVTEKAALKTGTPAKTCVVRRTPDGWIWTD
ncbi:MAG: hypothetical protein PWP08_1488 [Methanofollis sp.]|nr:hypothetical protein [Methanofollis sp.]